MRLEGKVALITGSASALQGELMGFGGAAAWLFVGAKVALSDINDDMGRSAVSEMVASGADAIYLHLDVTSEDTPPVDLRPFAKVEVDDGTPTRRSPDLQAALFDSGRHTELPGLPSV